MQIKKNWWISLASFRTISGGHETETWNIQTGKIFYQTDYNSESPDSSKTIPNNNHW